jgi:hypothetical protein
LNTGDDKTNDSIFEPIKPWSAEMLPFLHKDRPNLAVGRTVSGLPKDSIAAAWALLRNAVSQNNAQVSSYMFEVLTAIEKSKRPRTSSSKAVEEATPESVLLSRTFNSTTQVNVKEISCSTVTLRWYSWNTEPSEAAATYSR